VKPAKLFTMHTTLVLKKICALGPEKLLIVLTEIRQFFCSVCSPTAITSRFRARNAAGYRDHLPAGHGSFPAVGSLPTAGT
jgi:hypothetical protein